MLVILKSGNLDGLLLKSFDMKETKKVTSPKFLSENLKKNLVRFKFKKIDDCFDSNIKK
jgi:hypothetical protein